MQCPECGHSLQPGTSTCPSCSSEVPATCPECGEPAPAHGALCERCRTIRIPMEDDTTEREASAGPPVEEEVEPLHSRFVGRLELLQRLKRAFLASRDERRVNMLTLVGDPGVGKSRLAVEFARSVRAAVPDTRVLHGTIGAGTARSHAPIIRMLAERFAIGDAELPRDARDKIERGVAEVIPERLQTEIAHLMAHLLDYPYPASSVVEPLAQVPGQLEVRTYIAVRRFFEKDSENGALLLFADGVERAGPETVNLLHYLAEGLRNCPVFVLATARPTLFRQHPQWGQGEFAHDLVDVGPLSETEAQALFAEMLPGAHVATELQEVARTRLGGSPRAIEELTRFLVEVGVARPANGGWAIDDARLGEVSIPTTHEEILKARLRALPAEERTLIEKAAVVGEVFWLDAVLALLRSTLAESADPDGPSMAQIGDASGWSRARVAEGLERAVAKGLITGSNGGTIANEREYRFAYPPIWDLVYEMVDDTTRRRYHRLAAQWIELRPEGRHEQQQERAARHLERAGDGVMASARYRRAADAARSRYLNRRAIKLYTRALASVGEADISARMHIWHDLGSVYQLRGDLDAAIDAFERMLRLSWVIASRAKSAVAFNKMGRVWRQKGNLDLALEYLQRGLEMFEQAGDLRGVATSLDDIGQAYWMLGRYQEALDRSAKGLEMRRQLMDRRSIAASLSNIGTIEKDRGLFDEAEACYREAMELRREVGDRYGYVVSLGNLGALHSERGDLEAARDSWEDALVEAERIGAVPLQMMMLSHLGETAITMGKLADARQRIERAMALATEIEDQRACIGIQLHMATLELRQGNSDQARSYAEECLELAQRRQMREMVGRSQMTLGEVHASTLFDEAAGSGGTLAAEEHFKRAIKIFREMGNNAELAKALRRLGEYQAENNRIPEARITLNEAAEILERLGMRIAEEVRKTLEVLA